MFEDFLLYISFFCQVLRFISSKQCFWVSPSKIMQNHLEISSKVQFGSRNVRNWTKSRTIWVHMGLYGPIWGRPGPLKSGKSSGEKHFVVQTHVYQKQSFLTSRQRFLMVLPCSWVSWPKNDAECSKKIFKNQFRTQDMQNSDFCIQFPCSFFWAPTGPGSNPDWAPTRPSKGPFKGAL